MSGGSYDYLYCSDEESIMNKEEGLGNMRDRLIELGAEDIAEEIDSFILIIKRQKIRSRGYLKALRSIMKAVEWLDSGDIGMDSFKEAIVKFREGNND